MLNKKPITKKNDNNKYKPAGIHVLGEDYFSSNNIISEDSDFQENEKQQQVVLSGSSNILPYIKEHKELNQANEGQKPQISKKELKAQIKILKKITK